MMMDLESLDFRTIRLIKLMLRGVSLTQAADQCLMSTSTASNRISSFEAAAGRELFSKNPGRQFSPTSFACEIEPILDMLLESLDDLAFTVENYGKEVLKVPYYSLNTLQRQFPTLHAFLGNHPDLVIQTVLWDYEHAEEEIVKGTVDCAVIANPNHSYNLETVVIKNEDPVIIANQNDPLAGFHSCRVRELTGRNVYLAFNRVVFRKRLTDMYLSVFRNSNAMNDIFFDERDLDELLKRYPKDVFFSFEGIQRFLPSTHRMVRIEDLPKLKMYFCTNRTNSERPIIQELRNSFLGRVME